MKNFLKEHGLWILFAAAIISVALAVMTTFSNSSHLVSNITNTVTAPFRSAYKRRYGFRRRKSYNKIRQESIYSRYSF